MARLGLIVNPIAGMGGRCGLKGTDGEEVLAKARALGAVPEAPGRATTALEQIAKLADDLEVLTVSGDMGEAEALAAGLRPQILFRRDEARTSGEDTRRAAAEMLAAGVDLILFAGGDGTARDVYAAVGSGAVCLGVPAGCKIHSGVYGINPRNAGELAAMFLSGKVTGVKQAEVMDIDEDAFRRGRVSAALYGYLTVPQDESRVQCMKAGCARSEENTVASIAYYLADKMRPGHLYILGPGSTTFELKKRLGIRGTLLGVDVVRDNAQIAADVSEHGLLELLGAAGSRGAAIVVTIIGGQGYIFGRGNQQLSPQVIEKVGRDGIIVIADKSKVASLAGRPLLVDTGNDGTNEMLSGYMRVIVGYDDQVVVRVTA